MYKDIIKKYRPQSEAILREKNEIKRKEQEIKDAAEKRESERLKRKDDIRRVFTDSFLEINNFLIDLVEEGEAANFIEKRMNMLLEKEGLGWSSDLEQMMVAELLPGCLMINSYNVIEAFDGSCWDSFRLHDYKYHGWFGLDYLTCPESMLSKHGKYLGGAISGSTYESPIVRQFWGNKRLNNNIEKFLEEAKDLSRPAPQYQLGITVKEMEENLAKSLEKIAQLYKERSKYRQ